MTGSISVFTLSLSLNYHQVPLSIFFPFQTRGQNSEEEFNSLCQLFSTHQPSSGRSQANQANQDLPTHLVCPPATPRKSNTDTLLLHSKRPPMDQQCQGYTWDFGKRAGWGEARVRLYSAGAQVTAGTWAAPGVWGHKDASLPYSS